MSQLLKSGQIVAKGKEREWEYYPMLIELDYFQPLVVERALEIRNKFLFCSALHRY